MKDETRPVLVDSNVWLYMFLPGQAIQKAEVAIRLVKEYNSRIVVSTQVINETIRNIHRNRVMSEAQLRDLIDSFYADYSVVQMNQSMILLPSEIMQPVVCCQMFAAALVKAVPPEIVMVILLKSNALNSG